MAGGTSFGGFVVCGVPNMGLTSGPEREGYKMKTCRCGTVLDNSAQACPKCGKTFTPPYALILGIGLPLLALVVIIYSCARNSGPDTVQQSITDQDRAEGHDPTPSREAVIVNAYTEHLAQMESEPGYQEFAPGNIHVMSFIVITATGDACFRSLYKDADGNISPLKSVDVHNVAVTSSGQNGFLGLWKQRCAGKTGIEIAQGRAHPATVPR